jgi:hypothetical protein
MLAKLFASCFLFGGRVLESLAHAWHIGRYTIAYQTRMQALNIIDDKPSRSPITSYATTRVAGGFWFGVMCVPTSGVLWLVV